MKYQLYMNASKKINDYGLYNLDELFGKNWFFKILVESCNSFWICIDATFLKINRIKQFLIKDTTYRSKISRN